jgi:aminopeptidase N
MNKETPKAKNRLDYEPPVFAVETIRLNVDLHPDRTRVDSWMKIRRGKTSTDTSDTLHLDGEDLELLSVVLDGRVLSEDEYTVSADGMTIPNVPDSFALEVATVVSPANNTKLEGLYQSNGTYCTQCEAEGFRRITYFPDRPDIMATYQVRLTADAGSCPVLLSNGNLVDAGALPDGRHFAEWNDPFPKPSYLFALVGGDLACLEDSFTTRSGREVALRIYTHHGLEDRCHYAMDSLKRSMAWDEQAFGLEYDLDLFNIVAINDFNMGAMENKSLNVFNAKYILADPQTATDDDYANIEAVVAHEYFHNWTGNRVTCRDWFQLSLKEGLTVFRDQMFSSDQRSAAVKRIQDVRALRAGQFPEDSGPLAHPVRPDSYIEINNFYTATVYEKGAEVIGMYHTLLGSEGFRKGMDLYFERHDGQAVTCDDFLNAMADANGADLGKLALWYSQAGTPVLEAEGHYDEAGNSYELTLRQSVPDTPGQTAKKPMHLPVCIGLLGADGNDLALDAEGSTSRVLELTEAAQSYTFENIPQPPVLSLNRGFSAPIRTKRSQSREELAFLARHDSDTFNRWEAGQRYATTVLLGMAEKLRQDGVATVDPKFVDVIAGLAGEEHGDRAFQALACQLPSEQVLAEQMTDADPTALHRAREQLRIAIARELRQRWLDIYHECQSNEPFGPDARSAGRRALSNLALSYLARLDEPGLIDMAANQFAHADNMTDRMGALAALNHHTGSARDQAVEVFHERYKDDPVALDKWFTLQASSQLPGALERVMALMEDPAFSLKQPNKVRALFGGFAFANPLHFHAVDGSGYAFLADQVLELDGLNPQVAARMITPLARWRGYEPVRRKAMKGELERVLAHPGLSRDVYEMVQKSLAG